MAFRRFSALNGSTHRCRTSNQLNNKNPGDSPLEDVVFIHGHGGEEGGGYPPPEGQSPSPPPCRALM